MSAILRDAHAKLARIDARITRAESEQRDARERERATHRLEEQHAMRQHQVHVDSMLEPWGSRAPAPIEGQSLDSYRRTTLELARRKLPEDHQLRRVDPYAIADDATLGIFERQIFPAARAAATDPATVPPGEFREIKETDANGLTATRFVGPQSFIHAFTLPAKRVVRLIARNAFSGREQVLHGPPFPSRDW
jgi:hypothetical protein